MAQNVAWKKRPDRKAAATARVAAGATDISTLKHATLGLTRGGPKKYETDVDVALADQRRVTRNNTRRDLALLLFHLLHTRGCTHPDCPLAESPSTASASAAELAASTAPLLTAAVTMNIFLAATQVAAVVHPSTPAPAAASVATVFTSFLAPWPAPSPVLLALVEQHHVRGLADKTDIVKNLTAEQREIEKTKVACLCVWHHFEHTRADRGDKPVEERRGYAVRSLGAEKMRRSCEHELHATAPWASLVPEEDEKSSAFFVVAHLFRGGVHGNLRNGARAESHLRDLSDGSARTMCRFCDAVWTACELVMLYPNTPRSVQQGALLRAEPWAPFWRHFQAETATWSTADWTAERERIHAKQKEEEEEEGEEEKEDMEA